MVVILVALVVFGLAVSAAAVAGLRDARSRRRPLGVELAATDYGERAASRTRTHPDIWGREAWAETLRASGYASPHGSRPAGQAP